MRKWFLVDQKKNWSTKKMRNWFLVDQKKIGRPKKCEIDRTIGRPKRLTKSTWTPLNKRLPFCSKQHVLTLLNDQIFFISVPYNSGSQIHHAASNVQNVKNK